MNENLDPDQIAALFDAARSGNLPEPPAPKRHQRMRAVDFSRPTKFTADHQRRITHAIDAFCLGAAGRLTAELRTTLELETLTTTQVTWAAAQAMVPAQSLAITLGAQPSERRLLLTIESSLALSAIDALLGGSGTRTPKPRRFSEIDWTLTRRLMDSVVAQLSAAFADVGSLRFAIEQIEMQTDAASVSSVSEPTFVVMIEVRMGQLSSTMALLIPWSAIEPIADQIAGGDTGFDSELGDSGIDRALAAASVTLRAEVAALELPVAEILALEPGRLIRFGVPADDGVSLYIENVRLGRADPGANGARRAIKIRGLEGA
jgi:flagellar motor switch protein FliM